MKTPSKLAFFCIEGEIPKLTFIKKTGTRLRENYTPKQILSPRLLIYM